MPSIVVAHAANRVIGYQGRLPWRLPSDLRRFRELTMGHAVLMGRKTYESLPDRFRPLPGRRNVVVSANPDYCAPGAELRSDLAAALAECEEQECFIIGGSSIYTQTLACADRIYATELEGRPVGDAFFPELSPTEWRLVEESGPFAENGYEFVFRTYERCH